MKVQKVYCDICNVEITDKNKAKGGPSQTIERLGIRLKEITIEVITGTDSNYNTGDFCKYCIIDRIKLLDDRPSHGA